MLGVRCDVDIFKSPPVPSPFNRESMVLDIIIITKVASRHLEMQISSNSETVWPFFYSMLSVIILSNFYLVFFLSFVLFV